LLPTGSCNDAETEIPGFPNIWQFCNDATASSISDWIASASESLSYTEHMTLWLPEPVPLATRR